MISTIFQPVQPGHFFRASDVRFQYKKTDSDPQLQKQCNLADFGKMRSAEIIKNRVVPRETKNFDRLFETSLILCQKTGWFWTVFRVILTLNGKKNNNNNKQHLESLPFAEAHNSERATSMYSWQGVFTGQFIFRTVSAKFRIYFNWPKKPVSKTYRPKNGNFYLLTTLCFPFWNLILRMRS